MCKKISSHGQCIVCVTLTTSKYWFAHVQLLNSHLVVLSLLLVCLHNWQCTSMLVFLIITFWEISLHLFIIVFCCWLSPPSNHTLLLVVIASSQSSCSIGDCHLLFIIIFCCWPLPPFNHPFCWWWTFLLIIIFYYWSPPPLDHPLVLVMGTSSWLSSFIGDCHLLLIVLSCYYSSMCVVLFFFLILPSPHLPSIPPPLTLSWINFLLQPYNNMAPKFLSNIIFSLVTF